jgi:hypothetical protein
MVSLEQSSRPRLKTLLVALLCLCGAGAGAYFLYLDFNQSGGNGQGTPMAKIERREAKVRRKPSKSFAWNNAAAEEKLYRKDSVQTGVGSAAAVKFNDGTVLELGENSLVVIDDLQNLSLNFFKGAVVLHTAEGDKRVTVDSDGKAKFEELAIRLVRPEPLARFFTAVKESKPVRFAWAVRAGHEAKLPADLVLQISSDRGFRGSRVKNIPVEKSSDLSPPELEAVLPDGVYFWRLASADKAVTDIGQFRVIAAQPLQPVSPVGSEKLVTFGEETSTRFRWLASEDGSLASQGQHELIVARDAQFSSVLAHQELVASSGLASVRGLPEGGFFWRIQSRYGDLTVASRVEMFSVVKAQRPTLALSLPEDQKAIERLPSIALSWKSDAQGLDYVLELKDSQGKVVQGAPVKTRASSYLWKNPPPGAYRWRISAFVAPQAGQEDQKPHNVGETAWRSFSVIEGAHLALKSPKREQELLTWNKPVSFEFEWSEDELVSSESGYSYQVVVGRDPEFNLAKGAFMGPRVREAAQPSSKFNLENGTYYWKVLVLDDAGQIVKSSDVWKFAYGLYPPLAAPEAESPAAKAIFDVVAEEVTPAVTWHEVKGAEGYEVLLYKVEPGREIASAGPDGMPAGAKVVSRIETDKPRAEFKDLEAAGYAWSVRAIDRIKRKGQPMAPRPFTVTYGDVLGAPEVTSPEVQ